MGLLDSKEFIHGFLRFELGFTRCPCAPDEGKVFIYWRGRFALDEPSKWDL